MAKSGKTTQQNNTTSADQATDSSTEGNATRTTRRRFVEWSSIVLVNLIALIPLGAGLITFLDPWRRRPKVPKSRQRRGDGKQGFYRVTSLDALPVGGLPQRFPVIADQIDAWNFTPDQPIGAVFLQRVSEKKLLCFNATCPHAGCSVSCDGKAYVCPCHNSSFNLDGTKRVSTSGRENPSPRNMDDLFVDEDKLSHNEVWVEFKNFYSGKPEKKPKT